MEPEKRTVIAGRSPSSARTGPWLVAVNGPVDELPPVVGFAAVWPGFQPFGSNCAVTGIVP